MKRYICIDVGGTSIKYGLLNEKAEFLMTGETATDALAGGPAIMEKIYRIIDEVKSGEALNGQISGEIAGICISTAGMVDEKAGTILHAAPHLIPDYTGMRVKELIEEKFHLPCEVEMT